MAPLAKMTTNGNFGLKIDDFTTVIKGEKLSALPFSATNGQKWPKMANLAQKSTVSPLSQTAKNVSRAIFGHKWPKMAKLAQKSTISPLSQM